MADNKLGPVEMRFAQMIWDLEPVSSGELVQQARAELCWKKSTTYTVLRRLCDRGIFQNEGSTVTAIISREEFQTRQSEAFLEEAFDGSLPRFLAAFSRRRKLSPGEIAEIEAMIEEMR